MSKLGDAQENFSYILGLLLVWAHDQGYRIRMGEVFNAAGTGHKQGSNHYIKLAADLLVYKPGASEQDMEAHKKMHDHWDTLGGAPRILADMNHFAVVWMNK